MVTSKLSIFGISVMLCIYSVAANAEYYVAIDQPEPALIWIYCSPPKNTPKHKYHYHRYTENVPRYTKSQCRTERCDAEWRSRQPWVFYTNPPVYSESYTYDGSESNDTNYDTGTADRDW